MGIQTPMAQGRSTKIISMIKWIRTSRLSIKNSLSADNVPGAGQRLSAGSEAVWPRPCLHVILQTLQRSCSIPLKTTQQRVVRERTSGPSCPPKTQGVLVRGHAGLVITKSLTRLHMAPSIDFEEFGARVIDGGRLGMQVVEKKWYIVRSQPTAAQF